MAAKIIVVLGATGGQGGAVVQSFINKAGWKVRAVTRDPSSAKSQKLQQQGAEVVQADASDKDSLVAAFRGATAIYAVTDFWAPFLTTALSAEKVQELEASQGRNIVDAAATVSTLEHLVWSTLPSADKISGGKLLVPHFDGKVTVDEYIKASPLKNKTTYFWVSFYLGNLHWGPLLPAKLTQGGKSTYANILSVSPDTPISGLIDPPTSLGPLVSAIIAQPEKTLGKYVWATNGETYTIGEIFTLWGKSAGLKETKYLQVTDAAFESLHGKLGAELAVMLKLWENYGVYSDGRDLVLPEDLGVTGLKTLKGYLAEQNWSAYI